MTGMLASVNSVKEALQALSANVDIIDLKQPAQGALGALDVQLVKTIVNEIGGRRPVSATIGDLPMQPEIVYQAVQAMAETGVDYVKIGLFPGGDWHGTITKLSTLPKSVKLIAVLFADTQPDFSVLNSLAAFKGAMLDTMNKSRGSLTQIMAPHDIASFVKLAKNRSLLCGVAGSLRRDDIAELITLNPDYLGFRGALCQAYSRTGQLDSSAMIKIRETIERLQQPAHTENRVLIADDSEINRLILANMLQTNGYTVDAACDGAEALQFISQYQYRFALIDLNMPVMSGLEMIKILRERQNPLKAAAISSFVVDEQKSLALNAGFDYCLTRPVDEDQLRAFTGN